MVIVLTHQTPPVSLSSSSSSSAILMTRTTSSSENPERNDQQELYYSKNVKCYRDFYSNGGTDGTMLEEADGGQGRTTPKAMEEAHHCSTTMDASPSTATTVESSSSSSSSSCSSPLSVVKSEGSTTSTTSAKTEQAPSSGTAVLIPQMTMSHQSRYAFGTTAQKFSFGSKPKRPSSSIVASAGSTQVLPLCTSMTAPTQTVTQNEKERCNFQTFKKTTLENQKMTHCSEPAQIQSSSTTPKHTTKRESKQRPLKKRTINVKEELPLLMSRPNEDDDTYHALVDEPPLTFEEALRSEIRKRFIATNNAADATAATSKKKLKTAASASVSSCPEATKRQSKNDLKKEHPLYLTTTTLGKDKVLTQKEQSAIDALLFMSQYQDELPYHEDKYNLHFVKKKKTPSSLSAKKGASTSSSPPKSTTSHKRSRTEVIKKETDVEVAETNALLSLLLEKEDEETYSSASNISTLLPLPLQLVQFGRCKNHSFVCDDMATCICGSTLLTERDRRRVRRAQQTP